MQFVACAVGVAFLLAGLWFGAATLSALANDSIRADIDGQRVNLIKSSDPEKFRSAVRFQAGATFACLVFGAALLAMKVAGY